jgi:hypothetical protein
VEKQELSMSTFLGTGVSTLPAQKAMGGRVIFKNWFRIGKDPQRTQCPRSPKRFGISSQEIKKIHYLENLSN